MSTPDPLPLPTDPDGWLAFVSERPTDRIATVRQVDARLTAGTARTARERLALWNDAEIALREALNEAYLLSEAHPSADVRATAETRASEVEAFAASRLLDRRLWAAFSDLTEDDLADDEMRMLRHIRRDFRRGGVDLDDAGRERVRILAERDTELSLAFARNIREGRREIRVPPSGLAGLPDDFLASHPAGEDGSVLLTTEYTDLMPVREYARDRDTRTALVAAYNDLAWPQNEEILAELLTVRAERARLLGFPDWADYEAQVRMIGAGDRVPSFLASLDEASAEAAAREYARLLQRLRQDVPDAEHVSIADFWYLLATLKREEFDVDAQEVRSYFAFERVLPGVLATTARLLDVEYLPVDAPSWHPDVRTYDVRRAGVRLGRIHLDLHPRDGKYNHAACFPLAPGVRGRVLPEAVLLCNFSRGLLEHDEVVTFFHEFGHLVHAILGGDQPWARFSGFETEWDFVEAPSQLLEEWAWDAGALASFATNERGEAIPPDLVARMRRADAFGRALEVRRQLGHSTVSYRLHVDRPGDLQSAVERWYARSSPVKPLPGLHPYAGFGHLTGYGASYYTYQWSLVIARDLLSVFEANGLSDPDAALRYRTRILEPGGSRDADELVTDFLGRPFSFDAYAGWLAGR
ncbi:M3 family metallopeptidase [Microbacterium sp. RD1]|uniref:M3 family metallopeptidase n=1 Tax=Microbacterium sp. RD1 TaxID=3457313 RepID=UPI003FA56D8E